MTEPTLLFHDYETFGADPKRDRPAQFAAIRTDLRFRPVGEALSIHCKPVRDVLPDPVACLVTGISPQQADALGVAEPAFFALIHEQMSVPKTCTLGYNSIRFDDEFTRFGFWRNFFDPYAREWQAGNSRFDLIDLTRMCYALRPQGISWPEHQPGRPSFKLEHLAAANGLDHAQAHDALSDVEATRAFAELLRARQPRLFDYLFELRDKRKAGSLLDWQARKPVLHSSSRIPAERGATSMVMPLAQHPLLANAVIVFDLMSDPSALIELEVEDIRDRVFVDRAALPEEVERIPLKAVHLNKAPALAPLSTLAGVDVTRIGLDPVRCERHADLLQAQGPELASKVRAVFAPQGDYPPQDAELDLYGGLPTPRDQGLIAKVRRTPAIGLAELQHQFQDRRLGELLFRYRARFHPDTLSSSEQANWFSHLRRQLLDGRDAPERTIAARLGQIAALRQQAERSSGQLQLLDQIEAWVRDIAAGLT